MTKFGVLFLPLVLLSGCMTTTTGPGAANSSKPKTTTLERAQASVGQRLERMRYQHGNALLGAIQELIAFGELAVDPILEELPKTDPRTRANLVYVLGFIGGTSAHRATVGFLKDEDPGVRYEAAAALLAMADWSAVPVLISFLDVSDRHLRYKAFQVLKGTTRQDFGYHFDAALEERGPAIARWQSWWKNRRQELIYGKNVVRRP